MTENLSFEFDEINYWSELKLEIVEKYGAAYTRAFANSPRLKKYYIDGFSGAGRHVSRRTGEEIEGSPARALKVMPPFDGFHFIDMNPRKTDYLQRLCEGRNDVQIHTGDSSSFLINNLLPTIRYESYNRALCLLDPYGLHMDWEVMRLAGQSQAVDKLLSVRWCRPACEMSEQAQGKKFFVSFFQKRRP